MEFFFFLFDWNTWGEKDFRKSKFLSKLNVFWMKEEKIPLINLAKKINETNILVAETVQHVSQRCRLF